MQMFLNSDNGQVFFPAEKVSFRFQLFQHLALYIHIYTKTSFTSGEHVVLKVPVFFCPPQKKII